MPTLPRRARTALDIALSRAGAAVDRGALSIMRRAWDRPSRLPDDAHARMVALAAHYRDAAGALFAPPSGPPDVTRTPAARRAGAREVVDLAFPSRFVPTLASFRDEWARHAANLTARARIYRGGRPGDARPVIICLHGWGGGTAWLEERAFVVSYLLHIGLDVALFQLPFHGERTPVLVPAAGAGGRAARGGRMRSGALFPSSNVVRTNEAFGQAIWDLRALALHLSAEGAPAIGVLGMSLGGYTAALWAGLDEDLAFAGAFIPAVSMSQLLWAHGAGSPARREAERAGLSAELLDEVFEVHAPLARPPRLPRERLLVAAARGDLITPPSQAEALWRHWGEPELVWFSGGHVAQLARGDAFRALRRWLYSLGLTGAPAADPAPP